MPGITYSLALVRDGWRKTQDTVYLDRPNIITTHQGLRIKSTGMVSFTAFDIVYNHLAVNDASAHNRFRLNLEQGILDTNAEALILDDLCQTSSPKDTCTSMDNTAEQFASSLTRGEKWMVIDKKEDRERLQASADIQTRVDMALDEGHLVVFSNTTEQSYIGSESSWWIIDPETGRTLGIGSQGWGESFTEKVVEIGVTLLQFAIISGSCFYRADSDASYIMCGLGAAFGVGGYIIGNFGIYSRLAAGVLGGKIIGVMGLFISVVANLTVETLK